MSDEMEARAEVLHRKAQEHADAGDLESARAGYSEAVALRRVVGDPGGLAHEIRHLGQTELALGRLEEAEGTLMSALAMYRGLRTTGVTLANALRPLALLRQEQGRTHEAVQLWTEARALYAAAGIQAGVDEADGHLGI